ncbi:MAG: cysteine hydrolase [Firmicutes bacterium]|nr:cysteine hydrolase [Bacillota bacterium]
MTPALLIIDMLNDFISGPLKTPEAQATVDPARRLLLWARTRSMPIFYANDAHFPADREISLWGAHAMAHTAGAQVVEALAPAAEDIVLDKHAYSAFFGTPLDMLLRRRHIDSVILCGLDADICVRHTSADAYFLNYHIFVAQDAVAARLDPNWQVYYQKVYHAQVQTVAEIISHLS